jgi:hypothetical protein
LTSSSRLRGLPSVSRHTNVQTSNDPYQESGLSFPLEIDKKSQQKNNRSVEKNRFDVDFSEGLLMESVMNAGLQDCDSKGGCYRVEQEISGEAENCKGLH